MNKTPKGGTIIIACTGAATVPYQNILDFQGNLKELSEEDYDRLKKEILEHGFNSPIHVWRKGQKLYNLDGHQRVEVLRGLENEGYKIQDIPIDYIEAKNIKQAKHILLSRISQYGKTTARGLFDFLKEAKINIDQAKESFSIPGVDLDAMKVKFSKEELTMNNGSHSKLIHKCPKCGHAFGKGIQKKK